MEETKPFIERLAHWPAGVRDYVKELQMEMRRVTWPTRKQVQGTTTVVIVTVFAFAAYFAIIDGIIARAISKIFQVFAKQT
jgi:preprotein translocase subunit SecE